MLLESDEIAGMPKGTNGPPIEGEQAQRIDDKVLADLFRKSVRAS